MKRKFLSKKTKKTKKTKKPKNPKPENPSSSSSPESVYFTVPPFQTSGSELNFLYTLPKTVLSVKEWELHKQALTLIPRNEFQERKKRLNKKRFKQQQEQDNKDAICFYVESPESPYYGFPSIYGISQFGFPLLDKRSRGESIPASHLTSTVGLWDGVNKGHVNQIAAVDAIVNHCQSQHFGGILEAPTSSGKTTMGWMTLKRLAKKTIWLVPSEACLDQTLSRLRAYAPQLRLGKIQGPEFDVEDKDVVLAMVQSMSMHDYGVEKYQYLNKTFGLLILDELHRMASKVFSRAILHLNAIKWKLGVTATLARKDGMEKCFEWLIGPVIHSIPPTNVASEYTDVFPTILRGGQEKVIMTKVAGEMTCCWSAMINALCEDQKRNEAIVHLLASQLSQGRKILLFSSRVAHCELLEKMIRSTVVTKTDSRILKELNQVPNSLIPDLNQLVYEYTHEEEVLGETKNILIYKAGLSPEKRKHIDQNEHDLLIATYNIASTGLDLNYLDSLILACPTRQIMQAVGRLRYRLNQEDLRFRVFDLIDPFSIFQAQYYARRRVYKEKNLVLHPSSDIQL